MCSVKTRGGKCCVFPFFNNGKWYHKCEPHGGSSWCSETPNYEKDRKWDYCVGMEAEITVDDRAFVYANGRYLGNDNGKWDVAQKYMFPLDTQVVAIYVQNTGGPGRIMAKFGNGIETDAEWKCTNKHSPNFQKTDFDDSSWPAAVVRQANEQTVRQLPRDVRWIGVSNPDERSFYCRRRITINPDIPRTGGACDKPLGVESGYVENEAMTASSNWDAEHMAWRGRLNMASQGSFIGAWSARVNDANQWLQVDLGRSSRVTAVETQGRQDYDQWVKTFTLSFSNQGAQFITYRIAGLVKTFTGNSNRNSVVRNAVSPAIEARFVRIHPKSWHNHVSMRVELIGCFMACKVDVGILMDESGSVKQDDFTKEKEFVKDLVRHFQIGGQYAQFGVISFSTHAHLDIALNSHSSVGSLQQAVSHIRQAGGWTYTDKALDLAYSQLYSSSRGARSNVAKVLIIITDGVSTRGIDSLKAPLKRLKDASVNIISIGVGRNINRNELELMASQPGRSHVYYVDSMKELKNLVNSISSSSCSSFSCRYVSCEYSTWGSWSKSCGSGMTRVRSLTKTNTLVKDQQGGCSGLPQTCQQQQSETTSSSCPCRYVTCSWNQWGAWSSTCGRMVRQRTSEVTQHTVTQANCNGLQTTCPAPQTESIYMSCCKAELGIMMDESGSVNDADFQREKDFIVAMANEFNNYGPQGIQMGIITFSTDAHVDIKFNQFQDKASFIRAVQGIRQARGWTYSDKALNLARTSLFQSAAGVRPGVSKMLLILTDGVSTSGMASLKTPTQLLKASHVNIFTVGIGSNINKQELEFMASDPKNSHVFYVSSMAQLPTLLTAISEASCATYKCKYVTCDYAPWSAWSASCGKGMRRTRRLSKVNSHVIEQQGGCSGLQQTCDQEKTETKDMNCPCRYVTCSWNQWGAWSSTCGRMVRQRTSEVTQHTVTQANCNGLQTTCPAPETEVKHRSCCKADVGLILDESGSVSDEDFVRMTNFVASMAGGFDNFGADGIQMGVITFSTNPTMRIKFNQFGNKNDFMTAIQGIRQHGGWTYTDKALDMAREQLFTSAGGGRNGITKILLVVTDGVSTGSLVSLKEPIRKLRENGINIFSVGVGLRTNKAELEFMASDPKNEHMFSVMSMSQLPTLLSALTTSTCQMFKCKYVTCDYAPWSAWSASCGKGMRRTRRLSKVNSHVIEQQGGCSGLQQTCDQERIETKDMNCPCRYVTCAWNDWSSWSGSCGTVTRRRTSAVTNHVINKPSCSGLQTTCPAPETQTRTTNCTCPTVKCVWNPWTVWSASCGSATRSRTIEIIKETVQKPSCDGLPQTCPQNPEAETRKILCNCKTVKCDQFNAWSAWTATCGTATRTRTVKTVSVTVQKYDCSGLPQSCPNLPETEKRTTDCPCRAVKCDWEAWSEWSASCGLAIRTRTIKTTNVIVNQPVCSGLPQQCTQSPETESREKKCTCPTVECTWNAWTAWSVSCGPAKRTRTINTTKKTVEALSCDGLPQTCTQAPETDSRTTMCSCNTIKCVWNDWTVWSASCGRVTRTKTIKAEKVVVEKPTCDGLPQACTEAPKTETREVMCTCNTVNCTWNAWEAWSVTCGAASRKRTIKTTPYTVQKLSCDGLPQTCSQQPEVENRKTMCDCKSVKCDWNDWAAWSKTCGNATRTRTIKSTQVTVQSDDCSKVPTVCTQKPETEKRSDMCSCKTVSCEWGAWGNWSGLCGTVKRQRKIVQTDKVVQKESCDGLPTKCTQTPEEETNTLPDCEQCFTVDCTVFSPWSAWSATCGPATRTRNQEVLEKFVERPNCDNLPMECTGDPKQTQTRDTPPCGPTTAPPTTSQ
ncbi:uncharacterized protein LOC5506315 isoform X2 [Nematostella vectensis]|nr:uncharacterized protein LOC5506315 isoform X2 [Nematostella vectensis]